MAPLVYNRSMASGTDDIGWTHVSDNTGDKTYVIVRGGGAGDTSMRGFELGPSLENAPRMSRRQRRRQWREAMYRKSRRRR